MILVFFKGQCLSAHRGNKKLWPDGTYYWLIPCLSNLISLQCSHSLWKLFVRGVSKTQTTVVTIAKSEQFAIWSYHCWVLEATRHLQTEQRRTEILRRGYTKKEWNQSFLVINIVINFTDNSGSSRPVCPTCPGGPPASPSLISSSSSGRPSWLAYPRRTAAML